MLDHYGHIEQIPEDAADWTISVLGGKPLAAGLAENMEGDLLYRQLATLRLDVTIAEDVQDLEWSGAHQETYQQLCEKLGFWRLVDAPERWSGG